MAAKKKRRSVFGRLLRRLVASKAFAFVFGLLAALYVRLVFYTARWRWIGREHYDAANADPRSYVGSVWHGRLTPIAMLRPRRRRAVAMASEARDGEMIAQTIRFLGGHTVRGSSRDPRKPNKDRGGGAAAEILMRRLRRGDIVVITPDGPRGPRMRAKAGVALIAAGGGAPVLPVAFSMRRAKVFRSWDRFMLPWPFSRGAFVFMPLIEPPTTGDAAAIAAMQAEIEAAMLEATRIADEAMGRETPEPDAPLPENAEDVGDRLEQEPQSPAIEKAAM